MEIDIEKIEELIKYIPIINAPDFNPLNEDEPVQGLDIIYSPKAQEFIQTIHNDYWFNIDYNMDNAKIFVKNNDKIQNASLDDIRDIFSFIMRGERFCSGMFLDAFRNGVILSCLRRLKTILENK